MTVIKNKTAYRFFCECIRPLIVEKYPKLRKSEILAKIRAEWKIVKVDKKKAKQYVDMANEDKKRYQAELKFQSENPTKVKIQPKKNKTAYIYFCQTAKPLVQKKYSELTKSEIVKMVISLWTKIKTDKIKLQKYVDMANADKERYLNEMKKYNETEPDKDKTRESDKDIPKTEEDDKDKTESVKSDDVIPKKKPFFRIFPVITSVKTCKDEENYYYFKRNEIEFFVRKCYREFV